MATWKEEPYKYLQSPITMDCSQMRQIYAPLLQSTLYRISKKKKTR